MNEVYKKSWWGNLTNKVNWGSIYKDKIDETKEKNESNTSEQR